MSNGIVFQFLPVNRSCECFPPILFYDMSDQSSVVLDCRRQGRNDQLTIRAGSSPVALDKIFLPNFAPNPIVNWNTVSQFKPTSIDAGLSACVQ